MIWKGNGLVEDGRCAIQTKTNLKINIIIHSILWNLQIWSHVTLKKLETHRPFIILYRISFKIGHKRKYTPEIIINYIITTASAEFEKIYC